jgi:hypothetical protein
MLKTAVVLAAGLIVGGGIVQGTARSNETARVSDRLDRY